MSTVNKSILTVDGNSVHMSMPFAKVDVAKRLVSGYATLDNIDSQGDVVLSEASVKAFERARGNIREMHQPLAVGKMVDFQEREYFDVEQDKIYRGIYVTAYISEGAQDTWMKVLDGTLTGFSIGGEINEASNEFVKEANGGKGGNVRFIKDYDLVELSLVDNPANQLANIFSIQKSETGTVMKGMLMETDVESVFYCSNDFQIIVSSNEQEKCLLCDNNMENIGWFESGSDRTEKVHDIVTKFLAPEAESEVTPTGEGGVEMAKNETAKEVGVVNPSEEHEDGTKVDENADNSEEISHEVDDAEETEEVEDVEEVEEEEPVEEKNEESEIAKKIDEGFESVRNDLAKTRDETAKKVEELEKKVEAATEEFVKKATEIEEKMEGFGESLRAAKSRLSDLEKNLEKYNSSEALRKSLDVEERETRVQNETFWGNAFSGR